MRKYSGCLKLSEEYRRETELKIIANVKNDGMMMSKIKMFRISDELSSHIHIKGPDRGDFRSTSEVCNVESLGSVESQARKYKLHNALCHPFVWH